MAYSLKDLLPGAVQRADIQKEILVTDIVRKVNEYIVGRLPQTRSTDAKAISYQKGVVTIGCLNSSVAHLLSSESESIMSFIKDGVPKCYIRQIRTRIVKSFPTIEL